VNQFNNNFISELVKAPTVSNEPEKADTIKVILEMSKNSANDSKAQNSENES